MHVTACLAGQDEVDVEVGEDCRSLRKLKKAIVVALPQLRVEGFDVFVGGRALDDDEGVVSLEASVRLDVVPNTRALSILALREAGHEVDKSGLLCAAEVGDVSLVALYLDAGMPIDCVDTNGDTPLHLACYAGSLEIATLLLDRGSRAIDKKNGHSETPLLISCGYGVELATLFLDRGSAAINVKDDNDNTPLLVACHRGDLELATRLLDRGCTTTRVEEEGQGFSEEISKLLLDRLGKQ